MNQVLHRIVGLSSKFETTGVIEDGLTWTDPETAHTAAGDPGYTRRLPSSCWHCKTEEIAQAEAEAAKVIRG